MRCRILLLLLTTTFLLPAASSKEQALEPLLVRCAKVPGNDVRHIYKWLNKWYKGQTRTDLENEQLVAGGVRAAVLFLLGLKFMLLKRYGWGSKPATIIPNGDQELEQP
jgi:hypothetical protein